MSMLRRKVSNRICEGSAPIKTLQLGSSQRQPFEYSESLPDILMQPPRSLWTLARVGGFRFESCNRPHGDRH
jgi:hypothetical protein